MGIYSCTFRTVFETRIDLVIINNAPFGLLLLTIDHGWDWIIKVSKSIIIHHSTNHDFIYFDDFELNPVKKNLDQFYQCHQPYNSVSSLNIKFKSKMLNRRKLTNRKKLIKSWIYEHLNLFRITFVLFYRSHTHTYISHDDSTSSITTNLTQFNQIRIIYSIFIRVLFFFGWLYDSKGWVVSIRM